MYLSLALLADVLDHQEAVHGFRTDGFTMTIYGAIMAGMTGNRHRRAQRRAQRHRLQCGSGHRLSSPAIQEGMKWVFIGGETICYALIFVIFIFMGVEKFSALDKRAIVMDQKAKAAAEGVEYVDPAEKMRIEEAEAERASEEARIAEMKKNCEKKGSRALRTCCLRGQARRSAGKAGRKAGRGRSKEGSRRSGKGGKVRRFERRAERRARAQGSRRRKGSQGARSARPRRIQCDPRAQRQARSRMSCRRAAR